jgi:RimJ/RimL family protein N-acetyltransferase
MAFKDRSYNRRSILLVRKLELRKEGRNKRAIYINEKWLDLVVFSATCDEFGVHCSGQDLGN